MLRLPNELLLAIASQLESERDINALAQTNRRFLSTLDPFLYRRNIQQFNNSALTWSALCGRERTVKKALDYMYGALGISGALVAAEGGLDGVTRLLLSSYKPDEDAETEHVHQALFLAITMGFASIVKLLLDSGKIEPGWRESDGQTALCYAALWNDASIVKLLLDAGEVEVDSKDNYGRTPLSYAVMSGSYSIVELLLDSGKFAIESKDNEGRTPLSEAISRGDASIIRLLFDYLDPKAESQSLLDAPPSNTE
ncbi:hypothetical protein TGAM01_v202017 [Trichoderma gamsii]|uniref:F-box domain-containing protein n=1 Tax=Trichoderma gamsii TaxID=398673 RepID=A0A2P4ZX83_9HYPO|nr:hypothetical protein TGAM01_v202017 [Trichoderma gamsii]PON28909.1 hypothetical protein TGAM01_v202017 [Trichoderma gamsii]